MAPRQNSTLIDDNLDSCPSLLNLPEELSRYSPILPPKNQGNNTNTNATNKNKNRNKNNSNKHHNAGNGCRDKQNVILHNPQTHRQHNKYKQQQQELQQHQQHLHYYRSGSSHVGHSRRSRSISLYGVNSTVEQGNKEIPIWIGDNEPRYVSGVTKKTTCNDIIKALIDDEIHNGNYAYCAGRRTRKTGIDGAASRDYSDYVITESWRGIERSYNGNMAILPVWKAWSHVHNEIRLSLKHYVDIEDPPKKRKKKKNISSLRKYLSKLLHFAKRKKDTRTTEKGIPCNEDNNTPDEILFVILPDNTYEKNRNKIDNHQSISSRTENFETCNEELEKKTKKKLLKERLYRLSETRASICKLQRSTSALRRKNKKDLEKQHRNSLDKNSCIRRRKDVPIRSSIRHKLAKKTSEMDGLYDREYALTKKLSTKCKMYKEQNELYTTSEKHLEISIGQIQRNVEEYAKEIIQTEHELLELKNEIKQDISIINNLKRMTLEANTGKCGVQEVQTDAQYRRNAQTLKENVPDEKLGEQMQFVDNIYEFCDNNASMLV